MKSRFILLLLMCIGLNQQTYASQLTMSLQKEMLCKTIHHALDNKLFTAVKIGDIQTIWKLFARDPIPDVNSHDNQTFTPLMYAVGTGYSGIVQIMITAGADVNAQNNNNRTALIWAAIGGHTLSAKILIAAGAVIDSKDYTGATALAWAAYYGHADVVLLLIAANTDVNVTDNNGATPLILTMEDQGHLITVQILVTAGANPDLRNIKGQTARDAAKDKDAYDKAVAEGQRVRKEALAKTKKEISEAQTGLLPDITHLVSEYIHGGVSNYLPPKV